MPPDAHAAPIPNDHMTTPEQNERRKPKFDGTLNLGHVLQIIVLCGGFWLWLTTARVDKALLEARVAALENNNREVRDTMREMAGEMTKLTISQERMATSLEYLAKARAN